jgi:hypothetical protein
MPFRGNEQFFLLWLGRAHLFGSNVIQQAVWIVQMAVFLMQNNSGQT